MPALTDDSHASDTRAREFFLARQPILNREQDLVAYELLFRHAATGPANVVDDLAATAAVIEHTMALGLDNVLGTMQGYVNVDEAVLMSDIVQFLPADKVVLEILETVISSPALVERVRVLKEAGYSFALDDVVTQSEHMADFFPYVKLIKIDVAGMAAAHLATLSKTFLAAGKVLLAEKVETIEEFTSCMRLGFTYFQGYYFARPIILSGKKLAAPQMVLVNLLGLLARDASSEHIERVIKQEASIGLMLLRLVNTPGAGSTRRIDSLGQALLILGRQQLQRWLQILLYAQPGQERRAPTPLLALATTRGKLMELIVQKLRAGERGMADTAFSVGIMSLMDALFGQEMTTLLTQITVSDDVREALLTRAGVLGELLTLVESLERVDDTGETVAATLAQLGLAAEDLNAMQLAAFEWSNQLADSAR